MDRISVLVQDGSITLAVSGAVDIHRVGDLHEAIREALSTPGLRRLKIDCTPACSWDRAASVVLARSRAVAVRRGVAYQVIDPDRVTYAETAPRRLAAVA